MSMNPLLFLYYILRFVYVIWQKWLVASSRVISSYPTLFFVRESRFVFRCQYTYCNKFKQLAPF